jgi:hypothetical protein
MLHINQKYKPVITKKEPDYNTEGFLPLTTGFKGQSPLASVQGKGFSELISKVKDIKIKENHRKKMPKRKFRLSKKI